MNRTEFFAKLNTSLSVLSTTERKDILDEYSSHIDFKMQDGKTEEQAIADFGNIDSLTDEILEAYHIDHNIAKSKNLEFYIKAVVSFINKTTGKLLSLSGTEIAKLAVEFCLVLCVIFLLGIPFDRVYYSITSVQSFLPTTFANLVITFIGLILEFLKLSLNVLIVYSFINIRLLSKYPDDRKKNSFSEEMMNTQNNKNSNVEFDNFQEPENAYTGESFENQDYQQPAQEYSSFDSENANTITDDFSNQDNNYNSEQEYINKNLNFDPQTGKPLKKFKNSARQATADAAKSGASFLVSTTVLLLKIFLFCCIWLPCVLLSIFGVVATAVLLVLLLIKGIGLWGLVIVCIGTCVLGIAFTIWITNLIFGGKKKDA